jgi:hypothetical protein
MSANSECLRRCYLRKAQKNWIGIDGTGIADSAARNILLYYRPVVYPGVQEPVSIIVWQGSRERAL